VTQNFERPRSDWQFFIATLSSLPIWFFTSDPLWAVIILTTVDVLGFGPTERKAYHAPHTESLTFFSLFAVRNLIVIAALESLSVTTVLFPLVIAVAYTLLIMMINILLINKRRTRQMKERPIDNLLLRVFVDNTINNFFNFEVIDKPFIYNLKSIT